ncbi:MAG: T9SS type A sorting domain-containing protein [Flavobacteriales bacterium]|nr:T9SS type A sorting domain-containing protein [Flavobacteriales bacterium]
MRHLFAVSITLLSTVLHGQAPSWQWARSFPSNTYGGAAVSSLAQDSGYFMSLNRSQLMLPWGLVESSTAILLHMNALGEPTAAVAMPPIMRMLPAGEHAARFLIAYRDSCVLPDVTLFSSAGIGVAMGVVDGEGTISEVMNLPDLVVGTDCAIGDLDLAPNGDLLVVGWFRDPVQCADSTFTDDGYFLCRYTNLGELVSAMSISNPSMGSMPIIRVEDDGADGAYVAMQEFASPVPDPTYGAGTVIASFDTDWGLRWSRSSTDQIGLYSDGPVYLAKAPDGGLYAAYKNAASAFWPGRVAVLAYNPDGSERWMNNSFGPQFEWGLSSVMGIASSPAFNGPIVSIYFYGQMEGYGPYPITNAGNPNAAVAALDSIGQWKWAISDNGPGNVFGTQAVVSPNGTIYANGYFEGGGLGDHPLTYTPPVSFYAARISLNSDPVGLTSTVVPLSEVQIYPNPTTDHVWLDRGVTIGSAVTIMDAQGRMLSTAIIDRIPFRSTLPTLAPGIYFVCTGGQCQRVVVE